MDIGYIRVTENLEMLAVLENEFSNFSCMFLNPNNFFQYEL